LARTCADLLSNLTPQTIGMVLVRHGLVSFGETARESYERMIELVRAAEEYATREASDSKHAARPFHDPPRRRAELAQLRERLSVAAERPLVVTQRSDEVALAFACRDDIEVVSQQGPATPDHVLRTKRVPLVGRDVDAYVADYRRYFGRHSADRELQQLDPAPRIVLDRELGLCAAGTDARAAEIAAEIYAHTIGIITTAASLGGYVALPEADIFDVEYWSLEQAKLVAGADARALQGEIAVVTGGASGIGLACVRALLERGAAVAALDRDDRVQSLIDSSAFLGLRCDVTHASAVDAALDTVVRRFGGTDIVVLNAGAFPPSRPISQFDVDEWRRTMSLNAEHAAVVMREAHPLLAAAPRGGRVVVVASKNVAAPGPGAAAYSASKAALTQLMRIAALEWGADGIRVNAVHPDAVFDTALWAGDVLEERAARYGLSVDEYKRRNVLRSEITSSDVAAVVAELCGPNFAKTTGAQIAVDGGNERVI